MNVIYWSRSSTNDDYEKVSLEQLLSTADVVFPTAAKNAQTLSLITDEHINSVRNKQYVLKLSKSERAQEVINRFPRRLQKYVGKYYKRKLGY